MRLNVLNSAPAGLFNTPAAELEQLLGGPTLVHLQGELEPPIFVSVLLHGNELSGWHGVCSILQNVLRTGESLPRSLMLLIGNVAAAAAGVRTLEGQADFNRIWRNPPGNGYEFVDDLLGQVARQKPLLALDVHNNTGRNPHYSVLTSLSPASRGLAFLFSDKAVLVEEPDSVLSRALEQFCPAVAVEAGPISDTRSDLLAADLLKRSIALDGLPPDPGTDLQLYQALARIHVTDGVRFDFADDLTAPLEEDQLLLTSGIEAVNFHPLDAGFEVAMNRAALQDSLQVLDPQHNDVTAEFLIQSSGVVMLRQPVVPAMFTTDKAVVRQDCLGYLMRRLEA